MKDIADFLVWKSTAVKSGDTVDQYERWLKRLFDFTGRDIHDLSLSDIGAFRSHLSETYSQSYIEHGIALIRHFIRYQNEVNGLSFPLILLKHKEVRKNRRYVITESEYLRMLDAAAGSKLKSLRDSLILRVLWETGVRATELVEMDIKRLIHREKPIGCWVLNMKNEESRPVYWGEETAWMMAAYLDERSMLPVTDNRIFVRLCYGYPVAGISRCTTERIIKECSERAGIQNNVVTHSFRHAFIHCKSGEGVPDNVVAQMVGHKSPYMVMHYNALTKPELAKAWGVGNRIESFSLPVASPVHLR